MKDSLCNRLFISNSKLSRFRSSISGKKKNKKKRIDLRSQEVKRTLILQEESSCRVQPLRGDKVEGDHARVRNDLDASRGTAILEQRSSFFSHSHDVHAIAICFWSWTTIRTFLFLYPYYILNYNTIALDISILCTYSIRLYFFFFK